MKPYMIIQGSNLAIEAFEANVTSALEDGYIMAGEMIGHPVSSNEIKLYQPMMLDEDNFDDEDEEEDDDE